MGTGYSQNSPQLFKEQFMKLTEYEENMLAGQYGDGAAEALRYQVELGEAFDAENMVEITRVHAPLTHLDGDNWFINDLLKRGARLKIIATTNPTYDVDYLRSIGSPEPEDKEQLIHEVNARFKKIGLMPSFSCIPELEANVPRLNEIVAFSESSTVPYINGVIGARTNREAAKSALAAAITGRVPVYGLLLDENRKGNVRIKVDATLRDAFDYRLLGFAVGKMIGSGCIPVFEGMPTNPRPEELKALCTDINVSAAVAMIHIVGVTPEAPTLDAAFDGEVPEQELIITDADLDRCRDEMSDFTTGKIDFAMFGCAHYTIHQIKVVAELLVDKTLPKDVELWILTSPHTRTMALEMGYLDIISKAGGHIMGASCSDMPVWDRRLAGKSGVTDSLKAKFYNSTKNISFRVMRLEDCIEAALQGGC